jgi:hypothetical protein
LSGTDRTGGRRIGHAPALDAATGRSGGISRGSRAARTSSRAILRGLERLLQPALWNLASRSRI